MTNWDATLGCSPKELCDELVSRKPAWAQGSLSRSDARFLFASAVQAQPSEVVELGSASGFSTAVLCQALDVCHRGGLIDDVYKVVSYDVSSRYYADTSRAVGDAARELLDPDLLAHIEFRQYTMTAELRRHHEPDGIGFLFLDGRHTHPWPVLDLLAALDCLAPQAVVVMHDINLPLRHAEFQTWGAKYLYDDLGVAKEADPGEAVPNIGSIRMPDDKEWLRGELLRIFYDHAWEDDVAANITTAALA